MQDNHGIVFQIKGERGLGKLMSDKSPITKTELDKETKQ